MNITQISFLDLPFNKLFQDYVSNPDKLTSFFETNPYSNREIESALHTFSFKNNRCKTVDLLREYNLKFNAGKKTLQSVEKLSDENAIAVVTGQQLILYGGPLFIIYKLLSAVHFAKAWEKKYKIPCVPVFWMADEDHDYQEIAEIGFPRRDGHARMNLVRNSETEPRVAEIKLGENLSEFKKNIVESQFDTDFTDELWRQLDKCYQPGVTIGEAFGKLILSLFEDHGVVLAGTALPSIKKHLSSTMVRSVRNVEQQFESLKTKTDTLISSGYHGQVHLQPSNLFWIDDDNNRVKLSYNDNVWKADETEISWTSEKLEKDITDNPERFSPNVFLRPVLQNELLPGFAYIAGPGEIAYYAQMRTFYGDFDQKMPVIMPRFSATLIESGIDRIFEKLPFKFSDYNQRIEDLESAFVDQSGSPDVEQIFEKWKESVNGVSKDRINEIEAIDPTLTGSSEKAKATFFTELDKLKGKVYRSVKDQNKTQLKRIEKIKSNLFPNGNLQEREVAFIYVMNKYGLNIWNDLLENLEEEKPDTHKLIHL